MLGIGDHGSLRRKIPPDMSLRINLEKGVFILQSTAEVLKDFRIASSIDLVANDLQSSNSVDRSGTIQSTFRMKDTVVGYVDHVDRVPISNIGVPPVSNHRIMMKDTVVDHRVCDKPDARKYHASERKYPGSKCDLFSARRYSLQVSSGRSHKHATADT